MLNKLVILISFMASSVAFSADPAVLVYRAQPEYGYSSFNAVVTKVATQPGEKESYKTNVSEIVNGVERTLFESISQDNMFQKRDGKIYTTCGRIPNTPEGTYFLLERDNGLLRFVSDYFSIPNCAFIGFALFHEQIKASRTGIVSCESSVSEVNASVSYTKHPAVQRSIVVFRKK